MIGKVMNKHVVNLCMKSLISMLFLVSSALVTADAQPASDQLTSEPHDLVADTTKRVLAVLEAGVDPVKQPEKFISQLSAVLDPVVAFDYIATGVMGVHAKQATPEQRKQFTSAFKQGLVNTYGKGVSGFQNLNIEVVPPKAPVGDKRRVTVLQEVSSGGSVNKVAYSMAKNRKGQWKMINVSLNGINFGQTFRSQFSATVSKYDGDLAKAIADWENGLGSP